MSPSKLREYDRPEGRSQYVSHQGNRQRLRYLKQMCRPLLVSKDEAVHAQVKRAFELVPFEALMMLVQAREIFESTGAPYADTLRYFLDKREQELQDEAHPQAQNEASA